eukprot:6969702-Prymnesium_polylepis.1
MLEVVAGPLARPPRPTRRSRPPTPRRAARPELHLAGSCAGAAAAASVRWTAKPSTCAATGAA